MSALPITPEVAIFEKLTELGYAATKHKTGTGTAWKNLASGVTSLCPIPMVGSIHRGCLI